MTLKEFCAAAQRYWSTYLLVAGTIFALGMLATLLLPNTYVASSRVMVSIEGSTTAAAYQNEEVATRRIRSYIPLLSSDVVAQRVIDRLGLSMAPRELAQKISATNVPPKTSLIDIEVTDESPERVRQIADTVATEFIAYTAALETPTGEDSQKVHTTVVSFAAEAREDPFERGFLGMLALAAAVLLGAVAVWVRATRERNVPRAEPDAHARHRVSEEDETASEKVGDPN